MSVDDGAFIENTRVLIFFMCAPSSTAHMWAFVMCGPLSTKVPVFLLNQPNV